MTIDEVIAAVKNAHTAAPLTSHEAKLLVAEIERLRRIVGEFRAGLQSIAENPDWHDHPNRAAEILAHAALEL